MESGFLPFIELCYCGVYWSCCVGEVISYFIELLYSVAVPSLIVWCGFAV